MKYSLSLVKEELASEYGDDVMVEGGELRVLRQYLRDVVSVSNGEEEDVGDLGRGADDGCSLELHCYFRSRF
ncbi:hypothetical protein M0R45_010404 [Rubus argutus]|uniref:Uncharacterized protein n=1 Tax=Rubus argutus TaxID=59490 RepID=A0AAW1Y6Z0_RUBAR